MKYFIYFIFFGLLGWGIDTGYRSFSAGHYSVGTLLPYFSLIYGVAGLILIFIFKTRLSPWIQVVVGVLSVTALELVSGLLSNPVFHRRFWDYSDQPFNLAGHISLLQSFYWLLLVILLKIIMSYV